MSFVYVNKQARDPRAFAQAYCHRLCSAAVMTFPRYAIEENDGENGPLGTSV